MSARAMSSETTPLSTWALLSARVPDDAIEWRQDGKPIAREGKYLARFVPYIDAPFVQERLDAHAPGEWELTHDVMPEQPGGELKVSLKARLTVFGVTRDGVGSGTDYKAAASDSFKRAAVRFGIGIELYSYPAVWVQVDGDGKYAKALELPLAVYHRMQAKLSLRQAAARAARGAVTVPDDTPSETGGITFPPPEEAKKCPKCGGAMWDNRASKRNATMPDYKCKNDGKFGRPVCDGVIWPPRTESEQQRSLLTKPIAPDSDYPQALVDEEDDLPF